MPHKPFTLDQANRTLPLVRRIVADITALYPAWRDLVYRDEIEAVARRINGYLQELEQVGCVFKGFEAGLVDFYGKLDGREIFWCWKQGEDRIDHWHALESGFAGRQPVPEVIRG